MMKEIICSGIGGQGVLVAGNILADIAMEDGLNVSWYPSYGFEMRGGAANCELKIGEGGTCRAPTASKPTFSTP